MDIYYQFYFFHHVQCWIDMHVLSCVSIAFMLVLTSQSSNDFEKSKAKTLAYNMTHLTQET